MARIDYELCCTRKTAKSVPSCSLIQKQQILKQSLIKGKKFDFKIDTGADVSVISYDTFKSIQLRPALQTIKALLRSPGGNLNCVGYFDTEIVTEKRTGQMKIYVLEGKTDNLLSREAAA